MHYQHSTYTVHLEEVIVGDFKRLKQHICCLISVYIATSCNASYLTKFILYRVFKQFIAERNVYFEL